MKHNSHIVIPRDKQNEWWRYFSYSLVHSSWNHLAVNLVLFVGIGTSLHTTNNTFVLLLLYALGVQKAVHVLNMI